MRHFIIAAGAFIVLFGTAFAQDTKPVRMLSQQPVTPSPQLQLAQPKPGQPQNVVIEGQVQDLFYFTGSIVALGIDEGGGQTRNIYICNDDYTNVTLDFRETTLYDLFKLAFETKAMVKARTKVVMQANKDAVAYYCTESIILN
ncbi:hypothetical protein [Aquisalinus flavus]|uniref:Uncharacterized protein n=1 Tax=Aquisalinus flavus TaxID=1526572 RepID=A0A8J2Y6E3_9PROT|nr:hypothetical protein [Aquisalinus flavus]MBD0426324.1 hypothetical protein [Aquisalinus flavus]UNE48110.1 hypothetical protein FF099_08645 [Aquisalinus flavus]GGD08877.1 hypothetical protein GCM10011342_17130 [Aquisalinus flavus]